MKSISRILFHQKLQHLQPKQCKIIKTLNYQIQKSRIVSRVGVCKVLPLPLKTLKEMYQQKSPPKALCQITANSIQSELQHWHWERLCNKVTLRRKIRHKTVTRTKALIFYTETAPSSHEWTSKRFVDNKDKELKLQNTIAQVDIFGPVSDIKCNN